MALTTARVKDEWARRAIVEHESAANTSELLTWLILVNARAATLSACHRIVTDELHHSEISLDVLEAAGGSREATAAARKPQPLPIELDAAPLWRALAVTSSTFCCGETVAVGLFKAMHAGARRALAKRALARILRDEGRHRAFGWDALDELLTKTGDAGREFLQARVDGYVSGTRAAYTSPDYDLADKERAWGLMPAADYARAVEDGIENQIKPRFAKRGIVVG